MRCGRSGNPEVCTKTGCSKPLLTKQWFHVHIPVTDTWWCRLLHPSWRRGTSGRGESGAGTESGPGRPQITVGDQRLGGWTAGKTCILGSHWNTCMKSTSNPLKIWLWSVPIILCGKIEGTNSLVLIRLEHMPLITKLN